MYKHQLKRAFPSENKYATFTKVDSMLYIIFSIHIIVHANVREHVLTCVLSSFYILFYVFFFCLYSLALPSLIIFNFYILFFIETFYTSTLFVNIYYNISPSIYVYIYTRHGDVSYICIFPCMYRKYIYNQS